MEDFNICCKANESFYLTIRNNQVVFAPADTRRVDQLWNVYWSGSSSTSFAVVHKVTGYAIQHPSGTILMRLTPYTNNNDASILWIDDYRYAEYKIIRLPTNQQIWYPQNHMPSDGAPLHVWDGGHANQRVFRMISRGKPAVVVPVIPMLPATAPLVRIRSKLVPKQPLNYILFLAARADTVVVAKSDASDVYQQWYIYKSEDGSSFIIVNKGNNKAIKHPQYSEPLKLVSDFSMKDETLKWREIDGLDGYKAVKMDNYFDQVWDVYRGEAKDGTQVITWGFNGQRPANQQWIMTPCATLPPIAYPVRLYCKAGPDFSLTIRNGKVVLDSPNPYDRNQQWYKIDASKHVDEKLGYACSVYVNRVTGKAIQLSPNNSPLNLITFENTDDKTIVWTERSLDSGYNVIRNVNDSKRFFNTQYGAATNGIIVQNSDTYSGGNGQKWKVAPCVALPLNRFLVRVFCKNEPDLCLTIKNGKLVLGQADFTDKFQLWYKVDTRDQVNYDESNFSWPSFALVNEATNQAIKQSNQTVELADSITDTEKSALWFEHSMSDNSKILRPVNDISTALESVLSSGSNVILGDFDWSRNTNQRWFISPAEQVISVLASPIKLKVFTKNGANRVITNSNNTKVVLAQYDPNNDLQAWYVKVTAKDENGFGCFALTDKSGKLAIQFPTAAGGPLRLVEYKPNVFDKSIMWSQWSLSDGHVAIGSMNDYSGLTWDAPDGVTVTCNNWNGSNYQRWTIGPAT